MKKSDEVLLLRETSRADRMRDQRDMWVETARIYAQNSDYWRDRANEIEIALREVVAVADRKTDVFDRAHAVLEKVDTRAVKTTEFGQMEKGTS